MRPAGRIVAAAHNSRPAHHNPDPAPRHATSDDQNEIPVIRISLLGGQHRVLAAQNVALVDANAELCRLCQILVQSAARLAETTSMSTIPERLPDVIDWCQTHLKAWEGDPAAIGLDEPTVDDLDALTQEADAAERAYREARNAAAAALAQYRSRTGRLRTRASSAVGRVRAFAAAQPSPRKVLAEAQIPSRRDASPLPAPGTPFRFAFRLLEDGSLEATFRCDNRAEGGRRLRGVTYVVERRDADGGPFVYVETALERRFVDATTPPGTPQVTYRITAQTSTRRGDPALRVVKFGSGCVLEEGAGQRAA